MLRGNKSTGEVRFELITWGAVLITASILYVLFKNTLPSLMLFIPGLILLGSTIFQDVQMGWKAGWLNYVLSILAVATGLAGVVNTILGEVIQLQWPVIAAIELGAILIAKALYDPNPSAS